jgi:hypothetical protein
MAAGIIKDEFPWVRDVVTKNYTSGKEPLAKYKLDGMKVSEELGVKYTPFKETVIDLIKQIKDLNASN